MGCARCHKPKKIKARRMCNDCYQAVLDDGTAGQWTPTFRHGGDVCAHICGLYDIDIVELVESRHHVDARRHAAHLMAADLDMHSSQIATELGCAAATVRHWLSQPVPTPPRDIPKVRRRTVCPVEGCGRPSHAGRTGLCGGHQSRRRRRGGQILSHIPLKQFLVGGRNEDVCAQSARSYRDGCRCADCRRAATVHKQLNEVAGRILVDAGPVVAHLAEAKRRGMRLADVAVQAGVPLPQIYRLSGGKHAKTRRTTAEKVLAVPLRCELCDEPGMAGGRWCQQHYLGRVRSAA